MPLDEPTHQSKKCKPQQQQKAKPILKNATLPPLVSTKSSASNDVCKTSFRATHLKQEIIKQQELLSKNSLEEKPKILSGRIHRLTSKQTYPLILPSNTCVTKKQKRTFQNGKAPCKLATVKLASKSPKYEKFLYPENFVGKNPITWPDSHFEKFVPLKQSELQEGEGRSDFVRTKEDDLEDNEIVAILKKMWDRLKWQTEILKSRGCARKKQIREFDYRGFLIRKEPGMAKIDDGYFVYCLPRNRDNQKAQYNPYNLEVVSLATAVSYPVYWTLSASNVTMHIQKPDNDSTESVTTTVLWWLWERRVFHQICKLSVFCKFRLFKCFMLWRMNVRNYMVSKCRNVLRRFLFCANDVLLGCLMHVNTLFEDAFPSGFQSHQLSQVPINLLKLDKEKTVTLAHFTKTQLTEQQQALQILQALQKTVLDIVWKSCSTVAEIEGIDLNICRDGIYEKKDGTIVTRYILKSSYGDMQIVNLSNEKDKRYPLCAEVASWKRLLRRLTNFIRTVDYMMLEMLRRLMKLSLKCLFKYISEAGTVTAADMKKLSDIDLSVQTRKDSSLIRDVLIDDKLVHKCPDQENLSKYVIPKHDFNKVEIVKKLPAAKEVLEKTKQQNSCFIAAPIFDIHLILNLPQKISKETTINTADSKPDTEKVLYSKNQEDPDCIKSDLIGDSINTNTSPFLSRYGNSSFLSASKVRALIKLSPTTADFSDAIQEVIKGMEKIIAEINPLLQEPLLAVIYAPVLNDKTGIDDEKEEELHTAWTFKSLVLDLDPEYMADLAGIDDCIASQLELISAYVEIFYHYCLMVYEAQQISFKGHEFWKAEDFKKILENLTFKRESMEKMTMHKRVGMMTVHSEEFYKSCLSHVTKMLDKLCHQLSLVASERNQNLLKVMQNAFKKLDARPKNVHEFADHLVFLRTVIQEWSYLEAEYLVIDNLYRVIFTYEILIPAEDVAWYQALDSCFQNLKSCVMSCESSKDEEIIKFCRELDSLLMINIRKLLKLKSKVHNPELLSCENSSVIVLQTIEYIHEDMVTMLIKMDSYAAYQHCFESSFTQTAKEYMKQKGEVLCSVKAVNIQKELDELQQDISLCKLLWELQEEWLQLAVKWTKTPLAFLDVEELQSTYNYNMQKIFTLEKGLPSNEMVPKLKRNFLEFKENINVITSLCNKALMSYHWEMIESAINHPLKSSRAFTLEDLLSINICAYRREIQEISNIASNEATLEQMLQKMIKLWACIKLKVLPYPWRETFVIVESDDVLVLLEESLVTITTIKGSKFITHIKALVDEWERKLQLFSKTFEEWRICQQNWRYMEQIFSVQDIQMQMLNEKLLFNKVNIFWVQLMKPFEEPEPQNALQIVLKEGTFEILRSCNSDLEKMQKGLLNYLEIKRLMFPRFYFLSNDELLDIIIKSKHPSNMQQHIMKFFGNIKGLEIDEEKTNTPSIDSIVSAEGESLHLIRTVRARGPVEQWMGNLEIVMFDTVKQRIKFGLADYNEIPLAEWVLKHPGQVVLTVSQIMFTIDVKNSFVNELPLKSLESVKNQMMQSLNVLMKIVTVYLPLKLYMNIAALLTISVHNKDILTSLIEEEITSKDDFKWTMHLRYQWDEVKHSCVVHQSHASFPYGYEYLGCAQRLVITPLTERCFLTLTGALHLNLGGSVAGPSGTGKTESVKDLAKRVGLFLSGLSQSGSWCCLDEFNRIDVEVLSVVTQQIRTIKIAKDANLTRYTGRMEIPDNLKSLFRPVAMILPNYELITEILLFRQGFKAARSMACKIVCLYKKASRHLSKQIHYDFGLRAIKTVLFIAGQKKREAQKRALKDKTTLAENYDCQILIHCLSQANEAKLFPDDVPLFKRILENSFPGMAFSKPEMGNIQKAIERSIAEQNLEVWPAQMEKVIQFYNQLLVRQSIMLLGPTNGGKTTAINILKQALIFLPMFQSEVHQLEEGNTDFGTGSVEIVRINPKCVSLGNLYGYTDPITCEWFDGLIASAMHKFVKDLCSVEDLTQLSSDHEQTQGILSDSSYKMRTERCLENNKARWKWLIFDGPVDTLWVESLNTLLDDSKILCLPNGERINLVEGMWILFEVDSLSEVCPSTITRCAMVYMDPVDLGWQPFVNTWFRKLPKNLPNKGKVHLKKLFDYSIDEGLEFCRKHHKYQIIHVPDLTLVISLCNILLSLLNFIQASNGFYQDVNENEATQSDFSLKKNMSISSSTTSATMAKLSASKMSSLHKASSSSRMLWPVTSFVKLESFSKKYFLQSHPNHLEDFLGKLFIFSFAWSFGSSFKRIDDFERYGNSMEDSSVDNLDICTEFDRFIHSLFNKAETLGIKLPSRSIFDFFVDMETGEFVLWKTLIPTSKVIANADKPFSIGKKLMFSHDYISRTSYGAEIVPTLDIVRYSFLSGFLLLNKHCVLLLGDSGIGKSSVIEYMLRDLENGGSLYKRGTVLGDVFNYRQLAKEHVKTSICSIKDIELDMPITLGKEESDIMSSSIQLSAHSGPSRLQNRIVSKLIRKQKNKLGTLKGSQFILFVDDINMPIPDQYGTQPPLELLRQFVEHKGFYDLHSLEWQEIQDVIVVSACDTLRNPLSPRLVKHFCVLAFPQPSLNSLQYIYQVQLGNFFLERNFTTEVNEQMMLLVNSTIFIYKQMKKSLLPMPTKPHYTFNLRDISKVFCGLFQAHELAIVSKAKCIELFIHETTRVFHDRLVNEDDKKIFFRFLSGVLFDFFKVEWKIRDLMNEWLLFGDFLCRRITTNQIYHCMDNKEKLKQILEVNYMEMTKGNISTEKFVFFNELIEHIVRAARMLRLPKTPLLLVGYEGIGKTTVIQLAAFISDCKLFRLNLQKSYGIKEFHDDLKTLYYHCGHLESKTLLFITDEEIVQESFLDDISCLINSGEVDGLFNIEERENITMELKMVAHKNGIPDTKEAIYNFFIKRSQINMRIILSMSAERGHFHSYCRLYPSLISHCTIDWYEEWVKESMLSVANAFLKNADVISDTEENQKFLKERVAEAFVKIKNSGSLMAKHYQKEMRNACYAFSSNYKEMIQLYLKLFREKKELYLLSKKRLLSGLNTLDESSTLIAKMQDELSTLKPIIEQSEWETECLVKQLHEEQCEADEIKSLVCEEEMHLKTEMKFLEIYAMACEQDLSSVLPVLNDALIVLKNIDKASISELRVYSRPPEIIMKVMGAVCILFEEIPDWPTAKQLLADSHFISKLISYDVQKVSDKVYKKLKLFSRHPSFCPDVVGKASLACKSICQWILALEHYIQVKMDSPSSTACGYHECALHFTVFCSCTENSLQSVKSKKLKLHHAQDMFTISKNKFLTKQKRLDSIRKHLCIIEVKYKNSVDKREKLKEQRILTELRLKRANLLGNELIVEKKRWSDSVVHNFNIKLKNLAGDTLIESAAISYLGALNSKYRKQIMSEWVKICNDTKIPLTWNFNFISSMSDFNQVLKWQTEGLPRNTHSTENAIIMKKNKKWPLLVDPQRQAFNWISQMEPDLQVISAVDTNYMRSLETSIRVGGPVLIKDIKETIDPALNSILLCKTYQKGLRTMIKLGNAEIEYNYNFRLYLITFLNNPQLHFPVSNLVNIINFTLTFDVLQEQLLSDILRQEQPYLEVKHMNILKSIVTNRQLLTEIEDMLLSTLQKPAEQLLDNEMVMETLEKGKVTSKEVSNRIKEFERTERILHSARMKYLPIASRGAILYFILIDLSKVNIMYQFSLKWFQVIFKVPIHHEQVLHKETSGQVKERVIKFKSVKSNLASWKANLENVQQRLQEMITRLTASFYQVVSAALFSHHQLLFSFLICTSIMRTTTAYKDDICNVANISDTEWQIFLHGNILANLMGTDIISHDDIVLKRIKQQLYEDEETHKSKTRPHWVTESMWKQCRYIEITVPAFDNLCNSILSVHDQWDLMKTNSHLLNMMQKPYQHQHNDVFHWEFLTDFQKLILIKIFHPEDLITSICYFIEKHLGRNFLPSGVFNLNKIYAESTAKTPLIFILSSGCDPSAQLMRFSKEIKGTSNHVDMLSLGCGQGPKVEELISKALILKGKWVFLQNCHLAASLMPRLEAIVAKFNDPKNNLDSEFRLWLSSKPDANFPPSILHTGLKIAFEEPSCLKANMLRAFDLASSGVITEKTFTAEDDENILHKEIWKKLLFGLCLFHSVLMERKKYGALGWNIPYEFSDSDLEVAILKLKLLMTGKDHVPWYALNFVIGEVIYGGRVTDIWDRRCLNSLLKRFYCPGALSSSYYYNSNKVFHPPADGVTLQCVVEMIKAYPSHSLPNIFGMTDNAEIAFQLIQAQSILTIITDIQPKMPGDFIGSTKSRDEIALELADKVKSVLPNTVECLKLATNLDLHLLDLRTLKQLLAKNFSSQMNNKEKNMKAAETLIDKMLHSSTMEIVVCQEIDRFNHLLEVIHTSLRTLLQAKKGEVILSHKLEEMYDSLLMMKVPENWKKAAYESCHSLGAWVEDLGARVEFFALWSDRIISSVEENVKESYQKPCSGQQKTTTSLPSPHRYWLSAFFFPTGFLTSVLQNHSRKYCLIFDSLTFTNSVIATVPGSEAISQNYDLKTSIMKTAYEEKTDVKYGVVVFGLYLDGACWDMDKGVLCDSLPAQRFSTMPHIHFLPVQISEDKDKNRRHYECPIYQTPLRAGELTSFGLSSNFVTSVFLQSDQPPDMWVLRGVALMCQIEEP